MLKQIEPQDVEVGDVYLAVVNKDPLYIRQGHITEVFDGGFYYELDNFPSVKGRHIFGKTKGIIVRLNGEGLEWS